MGLDPVGRAQVCGALVFNSEYGLPPTTNKFMEFASET